MTMIKTWHYFHKFTAVHCFEFTTHSWISGITQKNLDKSDDCEHDVLKTQRTIS